MRYENVRKHMNAGVILLFLLFACMVGIQAQAAETESVKIEIPGFTDTSGGHLPEAEAYDNGGIMLYSAESSGWSYGSQLSGNAEQIYNTLAHTASTSNMLSYNLGNTILVKLQYPYLKSSAAAQESMVNDMAQAVHAFIRDYGEYYWMRHFNGWIQTSAGDSSRYSEVLLAPQDYYTDVRSDITAANTALNAAVRTVKSSTGRYNQVKAAHDYVVKLITYPSGYDYSYYHTITGGLLAKYNHQGVCECYAKLFKLLCNECGIPCILVSGGSTRDRNGNVIADHIWNYVQMEDGKWYLVDATWDDDESAYPDHTYFLAGSETVGYKGTRASQDHIPVGRLNDDVTYEPFVVPVLAQKSYGETYHVDIPVTSVTLKNSALSLDPGQGEYVGIQTYYPSNANVGMDFQYQSSNAAVASVNASTGYVTAKRKGSAVITVSSKTNPAVKATCRVTVREHMLDSGVVTRAATFTATGTILYTCKNGCGYTVKKTVPKKVSYVKLNAASLPLQVGKSTSALKITSYNKGDRIASWSSSNKKVATVDKKGKIRAKKKGTAVITVKMKYGGKAVCTVKVQKGQVKTQKLAVSQTSIKLKKGKSYTVKVVRSPLTANDKLKFSTSSKKIATVSSKGKIKAKKKGKATITVKSASGKKVKIKVVVY